MTTLVIFNQDLPVAINPDDVSTVEPRTHAIDSWTVVSLKTGKQHLIQQSFEAVLKALSQEQALDPDASIRRAAPAQWAREKAERDRYERYAEDFIKSNAAKQD